MSNDTDRVLEEIALRVARAQTPSDAAAIVRSHIGRPSGEREGASATAFEMNPETWREMPSVAKAAYRERNELLWRVLRAVSPGASGDVNMEAERVIRESEGASATTDPLATGLDLRDPATLPLVSAVGVDVLREIRDHLATGNKIAVMRGANEAALESHRRGEPAGFYPTSEFDALIADGKLEKGRAAYTPEQFRALTVGEFTPTPPVDASTPTEPVGEPEGFARFYSSMAGSEPTDEDDLSAWLFTRSIALAAARRFGGRVLSKGVLTKIVDVDKDLSTGVYYLTVEINEGYAAHKWDRSPVGQRVRLVVEGE